MRAGSRDNPPVRDLGGPARRLSEGGAARGSGAGAEGEMAVIALVEGFDEMIARRSISGGDLPVAHPCASGNVNGAIAQMIAVGHTAYAPIVTRRPVGA